MDANPTVSGLKYSIYRKLAFMQPGWYLIFKTQFMKKY